MINLILWADEKQVHRTPNKKSNSIEGCETANVQIRGVSIVHGTDIGWGAEAAAVTEHLKEYSNNALNVCTYKVKERLAVVQVDNIISVVAMVPFGVLGGERFF